MGKSLVIVESPGKIDKINKYLGKDFVVKASIGHIRDLPSGQSKSETKATTVKRARNAAEKDQKLFSRMGIDPEHGWNPQYEILPGKEKVVQDLITQAKKCDYVYLATDLDREGEAIAWHLQEVIGLPPEKFKRVVFNEITKTAILEAFEHPSTVNVDMVNAQQTRRFLDRVVGFMVSPVLWEKVGRGLSAGRVQSVAVRLIVEKERRIKSFIPEEFWSVDGDFNDHSTTLKLAVKNYQGKEFRPNSETAVNAHLDQLNKLQYVVVGNDARESKVSTPAPFTTSSMQQAASNRLGFSVKKTMQVAQKLYEAGLISYMRTDSTNLSADALNMTRDQILKAYGQEYLPEKPKFYGSRDNAQNAHEAIRPTDMIHIGSALNIDRDSQRLYDLIRNQVLACQMKEAIVLNSEITVAAGDYTLKATGKAMKFDGWTRVIPYSKDVILPQVKVGDKLDLIKLDPLQHFTKPEARYTEATLVKELEKRGIGRPSTYATIISTIQDRGYVKLEQRRFFAEKMGEIVTARLISSFSDLMSYDFTKDMELKLDYIAEHKLEWLKCLDDFYKDFKIELDKARLPSDKGGMGINTAVETSVECPQCHSSMVIKNATTGVFLACSNYAGKSKTAKDSCRKTINLVSEDELPLFVSDEAESEVLRAKRRCPICGSVMDAYVIDEHRKMYICSDNPMCNGYVIEEGEFKLKGADGPTIECDRCGSTMVLKTGRFGNYMSCTNEECKNTRKILKSGEIAPPKEDPVDFTDMICKDGKSHFVLRDGASGVFLASNAFPKVRETRAPKVAELITYKDKLPEKFKYLTLAPVSDEEGNPTVIKFSRKTKQQYVMAENAEGKSSGFLAFYKDGVWEVGSEKTTTKRSTTKKYSTTAKKTETKSTTKAADKKTVTKSKTKASVKKTATSKTKKTESA
jgi:DNA topoisomerase I